MKDRRVIVSLVLVAAVIASGTIAASAVDQRRGFTTSQDSMLTAVAPDVEISPILTVGDTLASGYRFEAIPDGIAVRTRKGGGDGGRRGRVDVYVNHETSKVPFPYNALTPTAANGENDFDNAQVSRLVLDRSSAEVLKGSFAISSRSGYQRFCSSYLATNKEGFSRDILFTNEESPDYVYRREDSWPPTSGDPAEREAGLVVALDVKSGRHRPIYGMGRHNHENAVAIPGFDKPVVLSGDDTFTSGPLTDPLDITQKLGPSQSQLYSYIAPDTKSLLADEGRLWAFVSDTPGVTNYYDVAPGSGTKVTGHFIRVPKDIATGLNPDGSELKAADKGYPLPPTDGSWQLDLRFATTPPGPGIDGPQWVLEYWSDLHDVFQFVRVEDMAYDKRPGKGNIVYIADSGRGRALSATLDTPFRSSNGRIWRMKLDKQNPRKVNSLTVFVEGDDADVKTLAEIHQPDNLETTRKGILVTEDPGSSQQFVAADQGLPNATTARLWYVPIADPTGTQVLAKVDQSADGGPTDVDGRPAGNWGAWESSGIVDASAAFGRGAFLIDVQAHTLWIEQAPGDDNNGDGAPDFTYKREGGQLLLIRIPWA